MAKEAKIKVRALMKPQTTGTQVDIEKNPAVYTAPSLKCKSMNNKL